MDWLKKALVTVYSKDGLVGVAVIVGLLLAAVYLFGSDIIGLF